jgi:hypothetical protein
VLFAPVLGIDQVGVEDSFFDAEAAIPCSPPCSWPGSWSR